MHEINNVGDDEIEQNDPLILFVSSICDNSYFLR